MSKTLFDGSDESDGELQLSTNKDYAKSYNNFRKKELLKKFKDRGYDVSESESTSDSESSEEDEVLDPKFDEEFFKTLASLKSKDPAIYDKNTHFFEGLEQETKSDENDEELQEKKGKKTKPVTLKDYERKIILENEGKFEDDSDTEALVVKERAASPTVVEEERRLKAEFKKVMNTNDSEEEEFGGIFKKREKTKEEREKEEADFIKWLAGKKEDIEEPVKEKLKPLKNYWNSEKLPQSERFLRDYILNKGYTDTKLSDIPTYDEIVGDEEPLSEDEKELEKQAVFEQKYNFRFEEPDAEFIQRYPRTIEHSVRRTDDRRKQKRQEIKERKQQEKQQKMKELEMVKEMKRKEIEEKIRKLKMVTGNDELGFKDEELEEDFDPEAHDRRMQEIFNDEYYQVDEGEEKPDCPSDIEELKIEDWDNYDPERGIDGVDYEPHCEDDDFNMDCDYDPVAQKEQLQKELIENTKKRKSRRGRRNRFMEMIQTEKPPFNPDDEKTYEEYIDEYYKLDCEDIIGDIPCRFKYVETTPNDFGLTIEEILLAKNKELNQWASLKKAIQIRPEHVEKKEQRLYKMKAKNEELKRKIFKSLYGEGSDEEQEGHDEPVEESAKKVKVKEEAASNESVGNGASTDSSRSKKKKKRKSEATTVPNNVVAAKNAVEANTNLNANAKKAKPDDISLGKASHKAEESKQSNSADTNTTALNKKKKKNSKNKATAEQNATAQQPMKAKTQKPENAKQAKAENNVVNKAQKLKPTNGENAPKTNGKTNPFKKGGQLKAVAGGNPFKKGDQRGAQKTMKTSPLHKTNAGKVAKTKLKPKSSKSVNKKFNIKLNGNDANISDERLKAYGINPRKFLKKQKYGKTQN